MSLIKKTANIIGSEFFRLLGKLFKNHKYEKLHDYSLNIKTDTINIHYSDLNENATTWNTAQNRLVLYLYDKKIAAIFLKIHLQSATDELKFSLFAGRN